MSRVDVEMPGLTGDGLGGRVVFSAGLFQFSSTPAEAPVVWCGGPLEVTFYGELPSLRVGRGSELVLVVGTPGIGPGTFAKLDYEKTIPKEAKPVVELAVPAKAGGSPLKGTFEIKERC
jgi:hypothetical protein